MTFSIPSGIIEVYKEVADEMINNDLIGATCTLVYPPKKEPCINCTVNTFGGSSSNVYRHGGPAPFNYGNCPMCGSSGFRETEVTGEIRLRVYWDKKAWKDIQVPIQVADGDVMTIGFLADMPKVLKAQEVILINKVSGFKQYRYILAGEPFPHGFVKDKYFMAIWRRA